MTPLTCMRRLVPLLAAFLMISCGDPSVSYCKKVADINTEYSEKSDALAERLLKLKKNPTLPGLEESSRQAAKILKDRDEDLADLSTRDVDPDLVAFVEEDRKLFARGRELAEHYQQYFEKYLKGGPELTPDPVRARFQNRPWTPGSAQDSQRRTYSGRKSGKPAERKVRRLRHGTSSPAFPPAGP